MTAPVATWPAAAEDLARRTTLRARTGAILRPTALGLAAGAAITIVLKAAGSSISRPPSFALLAVGAAGLAGWVVGLARSRRLRPVTTADAAWALDRLANGRGRGLTAALAEGPAAAEAAWADPVLVVPPAPLKPPQGLVGLSATALLAAIAILLPAGTVPAATAGGAGGARSPAANAGAGDAEAASADAKAALDAQRAAAQAAVREALHMQPGEAGDPRHIEERLRTKETLEAVKKALPDGSEAAKRLDAGAASAADEVTRLLAQDSAAEADALRRDAAALRAAAGPAAVPPERRALVTRWLASRLHETPTDGGAR